MTTAFRFFLFACLLMLVAAGGVWSQSSSTQAAVSSEKKDAAVPVEPDMHEFMEYVFQPTFRRLKPAMSVVPADKKAWKAIKADALVLAEAGNLLLIREPKDEVADWVEHSVQVREFGGQLYRAAKAKDHATARKHYESMVKNCNACHHQFAGGEHILTP